MSNGATHQAPELIGPYRVLRLLGEGSAGRVFLARDAARREVALKLLRPDAAGPFSDERFARESELLARLDDPGIARLYEAGTATVSGAPVRYLAMEYVPGPDVLAYAQERRLDLRSRAALLAEMCRAVHHAHTRGVIHRDLKPGNVLVGADGHPRVLDFGIARGARSDDLTAMTAAGQLLGTIAYMSPEQLGGAQVPDPRMDVYALGVIGYQLLAGRHPCPALLQQDSLLGALESLRTARPEPLARVLPEARGDLDTIVMKALAHEPAQRYASAIELAGDLERFLAGRPIEARPPTLAYVTRLFVRRHRALAVASALAALSLVVGAAVAVRYALSEAQARREAELRAAERDAVNHFLTEMLTAADPARAMGKKLSVLDVANAAYLNLQAPGATPAPGVLAQLQRTLGQTFQQLGEPARAVELYDRALALRSGDALLDAALQVDRASALNEQGVAQGKEAEPALRALLERLEGEDPAVAALRVAAQVELAKSREIQADIAGAEKLARDAYDEGRRLLGPRHPRTLLAGQRLASYLRLNVKPLESLALIEEVAQAREATLGFRHPLTLFTYNLLAVSQLAAGRTDNALAVQRRILPVRIELLGEKHPQVLESRYNLVDLLFSEGHAEEAIPLAAPVHAAFREQFGESDPRTFVASNLLATAHEKAGRPDEALAVLRATKAAYARIAPRMHPGLVTVHLHLANLLADLGRHGEAQAEFDWLEAKLAGDLGPGHVARAYVRSDHAAMLLAQGRKDEARAILGEVVPQLAKALGEDAPRTRKARERLEAASQGYDPA